LQQVVSPVSPPLATALRLAGDAVAAVLAGRSLTDALAGVPAASRGAVMDLSYGTVRFLARYRFLLERLLSRADTDPRIVGVLLAALHALASARRQQHTVVDQAVDAVANIRRGAAMGLVNAVLRAYLRRREALDAEICGDEVCRYCYPSWWIARVKQAYPEHWRELLDAGNEHPPMTLRVNRRRATAGEYLAKLEGAGLPARAIGSAAIMLEKPVQVERLPGFFEGWVSVQDLGAQFASPMLDARNGMRVLDACAAPGGKTGHLLELADVELTAVDVDETRLARVRQNLLRLGLTAKLVAGDCGDPQFLLRWQGRGGFDRILLDAPCSASGVVRRHPDAKWLRRESDLGQFASAQTRILAALWQLLGRDGKLLYGTCSVFPEENAERITAFLDTHRDATLIHQSNDGQLLPDRDHDGFYYALLSKER
jgi:16S rRNA (cytosine967-C5)-methyltransferase